MAYELDDDYSIMDDYLDYNELLRWPGPPHRCRRLAETAGIGH